MFLASSTWHSTMCKLTWRENTTKSGNSYYRLLPSMRTTEETESSSLPTEIPLWPTPTVKGNYNKKGLSAKSGDGLATAVKKSSLWPTPTTRDYKGGRKPETLQAKGRLPSNSLPDSVNHAEGETGQLNPEWVEWLMGFPIGWTESKD
jgi:DNA (cytosine-5)-methyltransferase 1